MKINFGNLYDYQWNIIPEFEYNISISYQGFNVMLENQEKLWHEYRQSLLQGQASQLLDLDGGNTEFDEDLLMIDEVIQSNRIAQFFVLFSFIESRVKQLCSIVDDEFEFNIKPDDLSESGGYFSKYIKYLNKVYGVDISAIENCLKQIDEYKKLRNIVIHSRFSYNHKKAQNIKLSHFEVKPLGLDGKFRITNKNFLIEFISITQDFLVTLVRSCDLRYGELKGGGNQV